MKYTCARPTFGCAELFYRVDYFQGVISGKTWQGKEYFRATNMSEAIRQCRVRASRLGLNFDLHFGVPLPMNYEGVV
jgi:hypothetical protein